jgi:hypothetical protein
MMAARKSSKFAKFLHANTLFACILGVEIVDHFHIVHVQLCIGQELLQIARFVSVAATLYPVALVIDRLQRKQNNQ